MKKKESLLQVQKDARKAFEQLKDLDGEEFKTKLIELTKKTQLSESDLDVGTIKGIPSIKHPLFQSKKPLVIDFWREVIKKTDGKVKFGTDYTLSIANKILLLEATLGRLPQKGNLSMYEIFEILNKYRMLFESVSNTLSPHFKVILKTKENHLDWSQISQEINNFDGDYNKLFKSMNGPLRNAIAHESYYVEDNLFCWIKDDGARDNYSIKKVFDKIFDLFSLVIILWWGFSRIHTDYVIDVYERIPAEVLKKGFNTMSSPQA